MRAFSAGIMGKREMQMRRELTSAVGGAGLASVGRRRCSRGKPGLAGGRSPRPWLPEDGGLAGAALTFVHTRTPLIEEGPGGGGQAGSGGWGLPPPSEAPR